MFYLYHVLLDLFTTGVSHFPVLFFLICLSRFFFFQVIPYQRSIYGDSVMQYFFSFV